MLLQLCPPPPPPPRATRRKGGRIEMESSFPSQARRKERGGKKKGREKSSQHYSWLCAERGFGGGKKSDRDEMADRGRGRDKGGGPTTSRFLPLIFGSRAGWEGRGEKRGG